MSDLYQKLIQTLDRFDREVPNLTKYVRQDLERFHQTMSKDQTADCRPVWTSIMDLQERIDKYDYELICDLFTDYECQYNVHVELYHTN